MNRQNLEKCGQHNSANVGQMDKAAVQWVVLEYKNILNISTTCSEESYVHMVKKKIWCFKLSIYFFLCLLDVYVSKCSFLMKWLKLNYLDFSLLVAFS